MRIGSALTHFGPGVLEGALIAKLVVVHGLMARQRARHRGRAAVTSQVAAPPRSVDETRS